MSQFSKPISLAQKADQKIGNVRPAYDSSFTLQEPASTISHFDHICYDTIAIRLLRNDEALIGSANCVYKLTGISMFLTAADQIR